MLPKELRKGVAATPAKHRDRTAPQPRRPYLLLPPHGPPSERGHGTGGPGGWREGSGPGQHRAPGSPGAVELRSRHRAAGRPGDARTALPALPACSKRNNCNSRLGENSAPQRRAILLTRRQRVSGGAVTHRTQRGNRAAPRRPSRGRPLPSAPFPPGRQPVRSRSRRASSPGRAERLASGSEGLSF